MSSSIDFGLTVVWPELGHRVLLGPDGQCPCPLLLTFPIAESWGHQVPLWEAPVCVVSHQR